jgi:hypothetical protein
MGEDKDKQVSVPLTAPQRQQMAQNLGTRCNSLNLAIPDMEIAAKYGIIHRAKEYPLPDAPPMMMKYGIPIPAQRDTIRMDFTPEQKRQLREQLGVDCDAVIFERRSVMPGAPGPVKLHLAPIQPSPVQTQAPGCKTIDAAPVIRPMYAIMPNR